ALPLSGSQYVESISNFFKKKLTLYEDCERALICGAVHLRNCDIVYNKKNRGGLVLENIPTREYWVSEIRGRGVCRAPSVVRSWDRSGNTRHKCAGRKLDTSTGKGQTRGGGMAISEILGRYGPAPIRP
ncbi:unnamed protein product, partial [Ectocarpus sp. 12 AP-2014]